MDLSTTGAREILSAVGARPPAAGDPTVDGLTPSLILEPEGIEAARKALAFCQQEGLALVPLGAGTRLHLGNLPSRLDVYLSTRQLTGVFDYEPGDLTVTAGAGTPLGELQAVLGAERQFLPWDVPGAPRATLGGIVAAGDPGIRRRPGARPRDLLLGLEAILADGTAVKAGGRVVKNVAGYEVTKLMVGSLGTLSLVTRVHLRVRPRPETTATLAFCFPQGDDCARAVLEIRRAARDPEIWAAVNPTLAAELSLQGWSLLLRIEGREEEVQAAVGEVRELVRGAEVSALSELAAEEAWEAIRDFPSPGGRPLYEKVVRLQTLPRQAVVLTQQLDSGSLAVAFPDAGLVYLRFDDWEHYQRVVAAAAAERASVVLEAAPRHWKAEVDVFGEPPGGFSLMKGIKSKLDPRGILAPGRFVGRL
jgi:glycolate oxidase FAD binding subunit